MLFQNGQTSFGTFGDDGHTAEEDFPVHICVPGQTLVFNMYSLEGIKIPTELSGFENRSVIIIRGWPLGPYAGL